MFIKRIIKSIVSPIVTRYQSWKHAKPVSFSYKNCSVNVLPGVYSPKIHYSTSLFMDYLEAIDLTHQTVLELGCGSGIISVFAASKGAIVTSSDINNTALNELTVHVRDENLNIIVVYSDLFENLHFHFDYILINPPIRAENPDYVDDKANKAGQDSQYYDQLFSQLKVRTLRETQILMILPDEAELFAIMRRAKLNHLKLKTLKVLNKGLNRAVVYRVMDNA